MNGRAIPLTSQPTVPLPGNFDVSVEKRSNELSEGKKKKKKKNPRRWRSHPRVSRPRPRVAFNFILEGERARVLSRTRTKSRECFVNRGKERGGKRKIHDDEEREADFSRDPGHGVGRAVLERKLQDANCVRNTAFQTLRAA